MLDARDWALGDKKVVYELYIIDCFAAIAIRDDGGVMPKGYKAVGHR